MNRSKLYVDEKSVRIVATQIWVLSLAQLYIEHPLTALLLSADFSIRALAFFTSPTALIAKAFHKTFEWKPKLIFGMPKRFAALLGAILYLFVFVALIAGYVLTAKVLTVVVIICALLESAFGICVGCYAFDWFVAPIVNRLRS